MLIIVESQGCHQGFKLSAAVTVYAISWGGGGGGTKQLGNSFGCNFLVSYEISGQSYSY